MSINLVLIGGGHAHAIALGLWGENPLPGVNLTLVSDVENTPYSGMLPGYVAGFYTYEETHINLSSLAKEAGVKLIIDRAIALDLEQNQVICCHHPPINFDYLSLDIGSTPETISVPGAKEYAIPAKPVPVFLEGWSKVLQQQKESPDKDIAIAIVGGGAGGVELALNMYSRLSQESGVRRGKITISLIHRGEKLLSGHNNWVSNRLEKILLEKGIKLYLQTTVTEVYDDRVLCQSSYSSTSITIPCNYTFWVTQATSPYWIKASGIGTNEQGFILVEDTLQSQTHPHIFAAGDIATNPNYPRPKAGVFAVRQGKPLFQNWRSLILGQPLQPYIPQEKYLALIGTGDRSAIASRGKWGLQSPLLWYLKDYIDRKFMASTQK
ncbi:MAG: FAD-dependent oxidoreductase [Xenococcaceae cyanobacterium MO_167.B27]|nr:FAD-dependent oxidoreductase [Xenococcaceae cyanobacterium MO_167.B27]